LTTAARFPRNQNLDAVVSLNRYSTHSRRPFTDFGVTEAKQVTLKIPVLVTTYRSYRDAQDLVRA